MAENCSYIYAGKTYSKDRLIRKLVDELPSRSQQESIDFLIKTLGMLESEILVIKGLIDGKSLGRFKADGKILLSEYATPDVAYHEAFHRVWRMSLSSEERLMAINEVKKRKSYGEILKSYKEIYPKLSDNELVEEYLADEFSDYTLNSDFKVETPIKTLFNKILNLIKKILGLKPNQVQVIYDKILAGKYKSVKSAQQYLKDADKVLIQGHEFSVEEKNELIQVMTQKFIRAMLELNGNIDIFINSPSVNMKRMMDEYVVANMLSDIVDNVPDSESLVTAVYEDITKWLESSKFEDSVFMSGMIRNLKLIGLEIKEVPDEELEGSLDKEEVSTREFSPSIEFDPKSKMGKKVKLLLSSLTESEKTTNFGFPKPLGWTKAFIQIATKMAGIPTSVFREELKALPMSYVQDLVTLLDRDVNFGNEFISTMAMTENRFYRMAYKEGDIYFADANSGTKREKIIGEWRNNLIKQMENWEEWRAKGQLLYDQKADNEDIAEHLGIELNTQIQDIRTDLLFILDHVNKYKGEKPDSKKIFKDLNVEGYIKALAEKQSAFEDTVDLMVMLGSKKLYTLGLNTQQTRVINNIRYAQSKFTPEMSQSEKIDLLREFAPMQVSEFNVTKNADGTYTVHNKWLEKILNGERLDLIIPYMADTESGEDSEIAKLDEADLMVMHLNGALQGINISMKHADRSTFFAYTFGNKPLYSKEGSVADTLAILEDNLINQVELERKFALNMQAENIPVQYIGKSEPGAFFKDLFAQGLTPAETLTKWKEYLNTGELNRKVITDFVVNKFAEYKSDVQEYGLLDEYTVAIYKDGKKSGQAKKLKGINDKLRMDYGNLDTLLASAFVNETSSHLFETRFFSGDVRAFKNGTDLFKRLAPQSSTGNLSVNDEVTNEYIRQQINQEFEILDPRTGKKFIINPKDKIGLNKDGYFRAVTGAERDNYRSHLTDLAVSTSGTPLISKLTGKQESKLFMMFESGFLKDFPDKPLEDLKKIYQPKFELYEENYKKVNENDGISYMVLPAFKKFMIRQGKWTSGMETVYQIEMKIASMSNMDDVANLEITVDGVTFKPFEITKSEYKGKKVDGWKKRVVDGKLIQTDAVHTLKTQFGGYSTPEEYYDKSKGEMEYVFNTIFKTSQHLLLPSAILGTNLQLMNSSLLSTGVDIYHMGSANKVGAVDAKLAAKNILNNNDDIRNSRTYLADLSERGLDFYDKDGYFNDQALTENLDILSYLAPWDDLKNQVQIGNKVKDEIKGSTQSLKILLSNLVINGNERFEGAKQIIGSYKEVVHEMVKTNHDNLLKKIGFDSESYEFTSLDHLKESILSSSQMESAPDNVRNAVENFFEDTQIGLETVPLKNKIENVLYALITNGIISFDRPGNAYPQAAVTGYEKLGSRKFDENGLQVTNQDTLKFYNPVFDDEGNVVKMEPAEVIMPLPDYWIKPLLRWAKTKNLVKALEKLNADIENRPELFQFKGLRIPNQQLSSNEFFQVKRFNLPTMQSYIIVPSEIVIKAGSDYDVDKVSMYWAKDTQNKIFNGATDEEIQDAYDNYLEVSEDEVPLSYNEFKANFGSSLDRVLLNLEKEILLHPRNAHHLLMPLTDEIFVKDIYDDLKKEGLIKEPSKSYTGAILPSTNVKNTTIFVKGKGGVGPVALAITNSGTNQADTLTISREYRNNEGNIVPTKLLFQHMGDVYSLDNYTDNKGTVISEILSQLLTTQVDNVKNPTAVLMNINMQTLGVILYLIRRKINPKSIVLFLQQPIIAKYLQYQRQNESLFNKQTDTEDSAKELLVRLKEDLRYPNPNKDLPDVYEVVEGKPQFEISDAEMLRNAKEGKFDNRQLEYLSYFRDLQAQSRAFSDFQQTQNSDTKGLKDKQMLDESEVVSQRAFNNGIIDPDDINRLNETGVISPFFKYGRSNYKIYNQFYGLASSAFRDLLFDFKNDAASIAKSTAKDRIRQTIENDFMLFLIHRYVTTKDEFDRLMKGDSVAKRVRDLKIKLPGNLVLKAFFPMLSNTVDRTTDTKIDNLRLFEKELNSLDNNDLSMSLEEIADADIDLYNDIVKLLMFQTGLNISPFNYRSVIPVGLNKSRDEFNEYQYLYQDMLKKAMVKMKQEFGSRISNDAKKAFDDFKLLFAANNPQFLRDNFYHPLYPYKLVRVWDRQTKSFILKPQKGNQTQIQLGDAYQRQYFRELINPNLFTVKQEQSEAKNILNRVFDEATETPVQSVPNQSLGKYELFPGVFANQGQTEALDKINTFLESKDQVFTLIGRGGTGKTTIIKKVIEEQVKKGKTVLGITVAHKAKKVLGKSIGKDKVKTVASALAIKLDESTGKFTPDIFARANDRVPIKYADIIIVDEASMISPSINAEIMELKRAGAKIIYMGDNAQLPPVGEQVESPVFSVVNQYRLMEKMRQAKTSPIIGTGSEVADNIESKNPKLIAIQNRVDTKDPISNSEIKFISDENQALDELVKDIKKANGNPDFVKAVTFNNEKHNSPQSVKSLNDKIRLKLFGEAAKNQFNIGEMVTAYDSYSKGNTEDEGIHNSDDFVIKSIDKSEANHVVRVNSKAKGERTFKLNYKTLVLQLQDSEGELFSVPVIANESLAQFEKDMADLWKSDMQLAFAVKGSFGNIQYGYAITSHKAQGSTYTNTYVFEDNILGPSNAGDIITKNKSLYVAVSRPTTKLVMISNKNDNSKKSSDLWSDENIPFDEIPEIGDMSDYQSVFELDQSSSMYSPSLKIYEGFINLNQLYTGDEILPFIGESEYYRYLVPMLLKMNPEVKTEFSTSVADSMYYRMVDFGIRSNTSMEMIEDLEILSKASLALGISNRTLNLNVISDKTGTHTIVHELIHRTLQKEYEKNGDFKNKIDELYSLTSDFDSVDAYGFTNPKEFLAEAMSNPDFMAILNNIPYKGQTVWTYLMTLISDFINNLLSVELKSDSVLAEVVRASEQVLNKNLSEVSKEKKVTLSEFQQEIVNNWNNYFPDYLWMNNAQREMTAKLAEEGKIQLNCKI